MNPELLRKALEDKVSEHDLKVLEQLLNKVQEQGVIKWEDLDPREKFALANFLDDKEDVTINTFAKILQLLPEEGNNENSGNGKLPALPEPAIGNKALKVLPSPGATRGNKEIEKATIGNDFYDMLLKAIIRTQPLTKQYDSIVVAGLYVLGRATYKDLKDKVEEINKILGNRYAPATIKSALSHVLNNKDLVRKIEEYEIPYYELLEEAKERINTELQALMLAQKMSEPELKRITNKEVQINAFVNFFRHYVDDKGKHIYMEALEELLTEKGGQRLSVDWAHLAAFNSELAEELLEHPEDVILSAEDAVRIILQEDFLKEQPPVIHVGFYNLPETISPRELRSNQIGKLIQIKGVVSAIAEGEKANGVKAFISKAVFICKDCGAEMIRLQKPYMTIVTPGKCEACGSRNIELDVERSTLVDMREVFVQDPAEAMKASGMASYVRVILLDDLARMNLDPGDEVLITAIVRGIPSKKSGPATLGWVLDANNVIKLTKDIEDIEITQEDEQKFKEMVNDPEFDQKLISSLAPSIVGREIEKKAVLLALFSGEDFDVEGTHVRKRSHVLLFGDAGTGKSEIITHAAEIAPRGTKVTGTHATGAGLTAAIDSLDGKRVLKAGAMVLGDRGFVAIDELDKMREEEYSRLLDAMEEGRFSFNKAGFNTKLMARAVVIATANPPGGEFDLYNYVPLDELKKLFPQPLYSRFDLIIPVFRDSEEGTLSEIAETLFKKHKGETKPPYNSEMLTKFIAYARRTIPRVEIPEELQGVMMKYMIEFARGLGSAAARVMEALIRLTEAHARMHLRKTATLEDFLAVKELYEEMLRRLVYSTDQEKMEEAASTLAGVIWSREKKREVEVLLDIVRYYELRDEEGAFIQDIVEEAKLHGIDRNEVLNLLDDMEREGLVYQVRQGRYKTKTGGRAA